MPDDLPSRFTSGRRSCRGDLRVVPIHFTTEPHVLALQLDRAAARAGRRWPRSPGHRLRERQRAAHRQHRVAHRDRLGRTERRDRQAQPSPSAASTCRAGRPRCHSAGRFPPASPRAPPASQDHADRRCPADHVVVGDDVPPSAEMIAPDPVAPDFRSLPPLGVRRQDVDLNERRVQPGDGPARRPDPSEGGEPAPGRPRRAEAGCQHGGQQQRAESAHPDTFTTANAGQAVCSAASAGTSPAGSLGTRPLRPRGRTGPPRRRTASALRCRPHRADVPHARASRGTGAGRGTRARRTRGALRRLAELHHLRVPVEVRWSAGRW
jgi:hypothetical protein